MELNEWIDSVGGHAKAAELLGEKPRTVYSWYRLERAPSFLAAVRIYTSSGRKVDFNGIYMPLLRKLFPELFGK
ncbi:hypothetical protein D3C76_1633360 [compost metagenome]